MPGLKRHIVSRWLKSFPSVHTALTRWGLTLVIIDVYLSTTGGNPTSSWALEWPALFMMVWDFLHQGTKCLYSSTLATTSYISCIEYPSILRSEYSFLLLVRLMKLLLWETAVIVSQSWRQSTLGLLVIKMPHDDKCLMFCRRHPLCTAVRHERGEPTVAIWRKSLNVRTPMGNLRAPVEAAIKSASPLQEREILGLSSWARGLL